MTFKPYPKQPPKPKKARKILKRTALKKKRKPTGELELFKEIWKERIHECVWCRDWISEFSVNNFDHIIEKSKAPKLRLEKTNIRLLCHTCHHVRHFGTKEEINERMGLTPKT